VIIIRFLSNFNQIINPNPAKLRLYPTSGGEYLDIAWGEAILDTGCLIPVEDPVFSGDKTKKFLYYPETSIQHLVIFMIDLYLQKLDINLSIFIYVDG